MIPTCEICGKKYRVVKCPESGPIELKHKCRTNPYLTASMRRIMQLIVNSEEQELTYFEPGGWWVESDKVNKRSCENLLRLCLIRPIWESGNDHYYQLTKEAYETFKNPDYVPLIIQELKKREEEIENQGVEDYPANEGD